MFMNQINKNKEYINRELENYYNIKKRSQLREQKNMEKKIKKFNDFFQNMKKQYSSVIIYGAGKHTRKLFEYTNIQILNILAIADTYRKEHIDLKYNVVDPKEILNLQPEAIIISSFNFQKEIYKHIKNKLKYDGDIIELYNDEDNNSFYT